MPLCLFSDKFASHSRAPILIANLSMQRFLSLLVAFASAGSASAQALPPDQPILPRTTNLLDAIIAAGPVMILLFALSLISVMLIVVYFFTIRRGAIVTSGYMATA